VVGLVPKVESLDEVGLWDVGVLYMGGDGGAEGVDGEEGIGLTVVETGGDGGVE
jgi:hypothetical protein